MKKYNRITPPGTRDLLFEECSTRRTIERTIKSVFMKRGFNEVLTPSLEYYDVFSTPSAGIPAEMMYKLTDNRGRILALRPDSTLPIARLTATRLQDAVYPLRLFYTQHVYRNNPGLTGRSDDIVQAGVELLGASGRRADLDVITTAVSALSECIPDFRLELGHAGYFKRLAGKLQAGEEVTEEIRSCIESKNYPALDQILDRLPQSETAQAMRCLPRLFGGVEVLEEATQIFPDKMLEEPLQYLRTMYNHLSEVGLQDKLIIDLGLVQRNDYYTDLVFQGYTDGSGEAVLSGGRYDNLLAEFGMPMPAAGFAINVDELTKIALAAYLPESRRVELLVHALDGYDTAAFSHIAQMTELGIVSENSVLESEEDAVEYARQKGIPRVDLVSDVIKTVNLE